MTITENGENEKRNGIKASQSAVEFSKFENDILEVEASEQKTSHDPDNFTGFKLFCFGIAGLPYQLMFSAISIFGTKFLLDNAKIDAKYTSAIIFVSRAIDAITDPIYGYFVNKSPITKYGKFKPWIAVSLPFTAILYLLIWFVPPDFSILERVLWFGTLYSLFFTVITGYRIPHTSLTMFLCKSETKRELATVARLGFEMLGILLSLILQTLIVGNASKGCERLTVPNTTLAFSTTSIIETTTEIIHETTSEDMSAAPFFIIKSLEKAVKDETLFQKYRYLVVAIIFALIFLVALLMLLCGVGENKEMVLKSAASSKEVHHDTWKELKLMFKYKPFLLLACAAVSTTTAAQIIQSYLQLYFEYAYFEIKNDFGIFIIIFLTVSIFLVPLWKFLMNILGKKTSYLIGNSLILPFLIGSFFFKKVSDKYIFYPLAALGANTITACFVLPWSMLPECMDDFFITYKRKPDALFYTFFILGTKVAISLYLGLGQLVLDNLGNYMPNICFQDQPETVNTVIRYLFAPIPFLLLIISNICIYFYPLNSQKVRENNQKIAELNGAPKKKLENGRSNVAFVIETEEQVTDF